MSVKYNTPQNKLFKENLKTIKNMEQEYINPMTVIFI